MGYYNIAGLASFNAPSETMTCSLKPSIVLGPSVYMATIEAADIYGNKGYWTGYDLRVMEGRIKIVGPVLVHPTPFRPLSGERAQLVYTLSENADVTLYVYDMSGRIVMTKKASAGGDGGRAGYNAIEWNGRTDFGNIVGNGIFVFKIISGGREIGKGKLVVLD